MPAFTRPPHRSRKQRQYSTGRRQEEEFEGSPEEFLATLGTKFCITKVAEHDLLRAEELAARTNQLNTTGVTYSYEELDGFRLSEDHRLLPAGLEDRFVSVRTRTEGIIT